MQFASWAEAMGSLVFMFEDHGLFKTPADLAPLAAEVLTVRADGTAELTCTALELIRRAGEMYPEMREPAACAVPWCSGDRQEHATFDPEAIEHASHPEHLTIGGGMGGWITQTGNTAPVYALDAETTVTLTAPELRTLAALLLERAGQLDTLTGDASTEGVAR